MKWLNNTEAVRFAVDDAEKGTTMQAQQAWFDRYEADPHKEFFTIKCDGQPIGFMGLSAIDRKTRNANLFILIGEDGFRGKGFGREALVWLIDYAWKELELTSIGLEVNAKNVAAIGLYRKSGFEVAGQTESELTMVLNK